MSGRGIVDLEKPGSRYRVDLGVGARRSKFETIGESRREDILRSKRICRAVAKDPGGFDVKRTLLLAAELREAGEGGDAPQSLASSVYMRGQRIRITGALWKLIGKAGAQCVRGFTIIPRTWEFTAEELSDVDPRRLLRAFLTALYGRGAGQARGWMFTYLHGEWDPIGEVYRIHVHGFAYGDMVEVIDRLRKLPNYKTLRVLDDGSLSPVYRRVRMTRKKLRNLPRPITYRLQSYWPAKALIISDDGTRVRARRKQRIREPYHTQVLLWLDRWSLPDLTLMIGLRVTKSGLTQTKPVS